MTHNPGGKSLFPIPDNVVGDAKFHGPNEEYRLWLSRSLKSATLPDIMGTVMFVGMNPSTARADMDDPTVRGECARAWKWGYRCYIKMNVLDYRLTDSKKLPKTTMPLCSPLNHLEIIRKALLVDKVIMCHGNMPGELGELALDLAQELDNVGVKMYCFGLTMFDMPKHSLYTRQDAELQRYN